jgi:hypothetical protein
MQMRATSNDTDILTSRTLYTLHYGVGTLCALSLLMGQARVSVLTRHALTHNPSAEVIYFTGATTHTLYSSALNVRSDMFTNTLYTPRCFIELTLIAFH